MRENDNVYHKHISIYTLKDASISLNNICTFSVNVVKNVKWEYAHRV